MRNLELREESTLRTYAAGYSVPAFLLQIVRFQKRFPISLLRKGVFSKLLMFVSYQFNR